MLRFDTQKEYDKAKAWYTMKGIAYVCNDELYVIVIDDDVPDAT